MKETMQVMKIQDIPYAFVISPAVLQTEEQLYMQLKERFSSEDLQGAYLVIGKKTIKDPYTIYEFEQGKEQSTEEMILVIMEEERKEKIYKYMQYVTERGGNISGFTVITQ